MNFCFSLVFIALFSTVCGMQKFGEIIKIIKFTRVSSLQASNYSSSNFKKAQRISDKQFILQLAFPNMKHQSKQVGESATSEKGNPYPATKGGDSSSSSSYHRIDRHPLISDYSRARSDELSDKSKELETQYEAHVPADKPFVMRLDGCSFKSFTRCLKKPFDPRLTQALVETSKDLVFHFKPSIGFCQSDEISLVFPAVVHNSLDEEKGLNHMYNGRVQKISSVAA